MNGTTSMPSGGTDSIAGMVFPPMQYNVPGVGSWQELLALAGPPEARTRRRRPSRAGATPGQTPGERQNPSGLPDMSQWLVPAPPTGPGGWGGVEQY
jgi:hypothetical protein